MKFLLITLLLSSLDSNFGFVTPSLPPAAVLLPRSSQFATTSAFSISAQNNVAVRSTSALSSSASGGDDRRASRLEGNMRPPTEEELELMDEMILKLADAKPYELPNAVRRAFRYVFLV